MDTNLEPNPFDRRQPMTLHFSAVEALESAAARERQRQADLAATDAIETELSPFEVNLEYAQSQAISAAEEKMKAQIEKAQLMLASAISDFNAETNELCAKYDALRLKRFEAVQDLFHGKRPDEKSPG